MIQKLVLLGKIILTVWLYVMKCKPYTAIQRFEVQYFLFFYKKFILCFSKTVLNWTEVTARHL